MHVVARLGSREPLRAPARVGDASVDGRGELQRDERLLGLEAPRARSPAARSAFTSACGPPNSAWNPSATTAPPWSTTAPTRGFGATRPQPRQARSKARRIASRSDGGESSEVEAKARAPEDMP